MVVTDELALTLAAANGHQPVKIPLDMGAY